MQLQSMKHYYFASLFLALLCSCGADQTQRQSFYFGGEIVNPTSEYVVLFKGDEAVDSARLDASGRFVIQVDTLEKGLYNFYHRPEYQYLYLEPGDSLQIRINTVAFDESLIYTGVGESVNNLLMDLFLQAESEDGVIRDTYASLEPGVFHDKMDSLLQAKLQQLDLVQAETPLTEEGYKMVHATIEYKNYFYRESYPFWHRKLSEDRTLHPLPENFYDYRNQVVYNDSDLTFLRPYYDFMKFHIANIAYMGCKESCDSTMLEGSNALHFNRHQLAIIDSLVPQTELKDNLLRTVAFDYLLKLDSEAHFETFMQDLKMRSESNRHLDEILNLRASIKQLRPNQLLPDLYVRNASGDSLSLRQLPPDNRQTVLYFWSGPQPRHLRNISQKVRMLENQFPDSRFIGVSLRTDWDRWKELVDSYGLNPEQQFWAGDYESFAHSLVVYHPYKCIIARDSVIVDGFANLNASFK